MIKKLRWRVVTLTMIAVAVVLLLLMGIINTVNYVQLNNSTNKVLDILAENNGSFPLLDALDSPPEDSSDTMEPHGEDSQDNPDNFDPHGGPGNKKRFDIRPGMSEETPFETRFFSATINSQGEITDINVSNIAAITQDEAMDMAISANKRSKESSTIKSSYGIYKYKRVQLEDDSTMYVFVDCTRDRRYTSEFLVTSILVSLCGMLAVAVLVILLSPMMIRPIAESYDKQKKFITNAGHELKTPLAVIESCTEVMEMESGQTKWTQGIHEQVGRLSTLTGQLVALAKMDERADGSEALPMEDIDFTSLVNDTLKPFELMAEQKGLGFTVEAPTPITIKGNSASLTELINILADNAIKYTSPGGEIKFSLLKKGSHAVLMEENPAEGLSPGSQDALFDRFHRGELSHNNDTVSGYGIGLSMAQSIVNAHGGKISASSPDGTNLIIKAEI